MDLINKALSKNGYNFVNDLGWRYQTIITLANEYQLKGEIMKLVTLYDLAREIRKDRYVIASLVSPSGGHLCLFFGFKTNKVGKIKLFYYHDPNNYQGGGKNLSISRQKLSTIFKNKAIAIWK